VPTIAIERTRNGVLRSAEAAFLRVTNNSGVTVVATTPVVPIAEGVYSYQADTLVSGSYTAIWTFQNNGYPDDVITRVFTLDAATAIPDGVTLMEIEQLTARRACPYMKVTATAGCTVNRLAATKLQSSLSLGTYEDHFMLRRGITTSGILVPVFTQADRSRMVASYDSSNGWLNADRLWTYAPDATNGESVEVMALDPDSELRPAVLDGLKQCFFWDTVDIAITEQEAGYRINLTPMIPWLSNPRAIRDVEFSYVGPRIRPARMPWWKVVRYGRSIYLHTQDSMVGNLTITLLRPAHTLVNEEQSLTGPNDDLDTLYVNPSYAAWAAVVALWQNNPERMAPLSHEGLRTDLKGAAAEFTKHSLRVANEAPPEFTQLDFGRPDLGSVTIGNLAEPHV
jgi:hypothetical protein